MNEMKRARISAVYNVFAFVMIECFYNGITKITDSLHPGNGGNPAFAKYDMDSNMRMVFYPAVLGWIFFSYWLFDNKNTRT